MTDIYAQFDKATGSTTAVALIFEGKVAGRVIIRFGAACTAYAHIWGAEMAKGRATGGGYDRATAAVGAALCKMMTRPNDRDEFANRAFDAALGGGAYMNGGEGWERVLENRGFTLARVI
ncbi:MAG TPA: hypothetical protein VF638_14790 [Sphingomonas sp.]|jgi:hypothetical protein